MEYENMRVSELKALARERGLRGYSRLRRVTLLQNNPPPAPRTPVPRRPPPPPPQMSTWEPIDDRFRPDRPRQPRQPTQQEMDIFEQQEMSKSRPQVKNKLNDWYDWLENHVPKTVKDKASRVFKTFKDKIMGLYNGITGSTAPGAGNQVQRSTEPELFNPIERDFGGSYRSYRINGRPRMDVETFFHQIRKGLIDLIKRELNDLN